MPSPQYDSSTFPDFPFGHVLPPRVNPSLRDRQELLGCLSAAIYLASQIELAEGSINLRVEPIKSIYFRAALAELLRVEDITKSYGRHFKFPATLNPLLHAIRLLRNYNVHIGSFKLEPGARLVRWQGNEGVFHSFIADNISATELRRLDSSALYTDAQLTELVALFNTHQRRFGVVQLLYNTTLHIASLIE